MRVNPSNVLKGIYKELYDSQIKIGTKDEFSCRKNRDWNTYNKLDYPSQCLVRLNEIKEYNAKNRIK